MQEPVGEQVETRARSTSKSAVSRTFVERTREALGELMAASWGSALAVMMIDGVELEGPDDDRRAGDHDRGREDPARAVGRITENATVATALLSDLVERGLDPEQGMLFVIDGAKALRKAVRSVFGEAPVQRCLCHKERNVLEHLAERDRPPSRAGCAGRGRRPTTRGRSSSSRRLAGELDHTHPGAAGSLREGMEETLTVTRLGIKGKLRRTLESTNPCESMIECVRRTQRNVKHWQNGEMGLRWTAAGMLEAEQQFRKVIGYTDRAAARARDRTPSPPSPAQHPHRPRRPLSPSLVTITPGPRHRSSTPTGTTSRALNDQVELAVIDLLGRPQHPQRKHPAGRELLGDLSRAIDFKLNTYQRDALLAAILIPVIQPVPGDEQPTARVAIRRAVGVRSAAGVLVD